MNLILYRGNTAINASIKVEGSQVVTSCNGMMTAIMTDDPERCALRLKWSWERNAYADFPPRPVMIDPVPVLVREQAGDEITITPGIWIGIIPRKAKDGKEQTPSYLVVINGEERPVSACYVHSTRDASV